MEYERNSASDSEGESSLDETSDINGFANSLINGTSVDQFGNELDSNATLSQRVFHAAKDGMALTLYALLANQARPQQVCN